MIAANDIDLNDAPRYRKRTCVLAFFNPAGATIDKHEAWGTNQELPQGHFLICGTVEPDPRAVGQVVLRPEVYGCAAEEFLARYEPVGRANVYRKKTAVQALRLDEPFIVAKPAPSDRQAAGETGEPGDWLVLQADGARQRIQGNRFEELYERVPW